MKRVIIDTNMLMAVAQFRVDIFSEIERICLFNYRLYAIDRTIDELNSIRENQKGRHKEAAKLALALFKSDKISKIKTEPCGNVDDIILGMADREKDIVATQDVHLKQKLKAMGISIITMRQKKYLIFQN